MLQNNNWKYFKCQQCGKCCEEIGLAYDPYSLKEIANYLKISINELIETYYGKFTTDGKYFEPDDNKRTPCPFLKSEESMKFCAIYPVRPEGCRLYPLETDFGRDGVDCPAANIVFSKIYSGQRQLKFTN